MNRKYTFLLLSFSLVIITCRAKPTTSPNEPPKAAPHRPEQVPVEFDCLAREFVWQYAQQLQSWRPNIADVYDALQLSSLCNSTMEKQTMRVPVPKVNLPVRATEYYVDFNKGSDSNQGSLNSPFKTIQRAVTVAVSHATIFLRAGTHYLTSTINLGPENAGLIFSSYYGESVQINGGTPLTTKWLPYNTSYSTPIYQNKNNVVGRASSRSNTRGVVYLGDFDSDRECLTACLKYNDNGDLCKSWTWYDAYSKGEWAYQCFGSTDDYWNPSSVEGHTSGKIQALNIYVADLSGQNVQQMLGLQLKGQRCVRARYPNANPETDLYPVGYIPYAHKWCHPRIFPEAQTYTLTSPIRDTGVAFQQFTIGTGGACSVFDPPQSYWCSSERAGGGAALYVVPQGLAWNNGTFVNGEWKNPIGGLVHAFQNGYWENWMFEIDYYNPDNNTVLWTLGGFQGARGSQKGGGAWFVENIFEELDAPNEFFYDTPNQQLYYFYNGSGAPPSDSQSFVATNLKVLFNVTGSQQSPVTEIIFYNITFQNAAYTYMDPHGVPSGGDWSLQRTGALFFEGTEGLAVVQCTFIRLDGIALFLSGYNRNATIAQNEFVWIGDSAMASWGRTTDNLVNGTEGDFPRYTRVQYNFVHEHGQYTKQSSAWVQAKTAQTYFEGNIFFNGPRAGININDGFGGGNELFQNLLFNQVRETSDHGPFNSWDREPFWTNVGNASGSFNQMYNEIHHNVFLCNYNSQACIDNDDGSTFFKNHNNFEIYGCHKDYYAGHNKYTYDTVLAYPVCWGHGCGFFTEFVPGYVDGVYNVSCIQGTVMPYVDYYGTGFNVSIPAAMPFMANNRIYSNTTNLTIAYNGQNIPIATWQAMGQDLGTQLFPIPSPEEIITMGKQVLASGR